MGAWEVDLLTSQINLFGILKHVFGHPEPTSLAELRNQLLEDDLPVFDGFMARASRSTEKEKARVRIAGEGQIALEFTGISSSEDASLRVVGVVNVYRVESDLTEKGLN